MVSSDDKKEQSHAFISYVREDVDQVNTIVEILRANGIAVWIDQDSIPVGARFDRLIRNAIRVGDHFICFFSATRASKARSLAHDELLLAVEELRRRPQDRAWFIPVILDDTDLPDIPIGAGEDLRSLQWFDLRDNKPSSIQRLLATLGVKTPIVDILLPPRLIVRCIEFGLFGTDVMLKTARLAVQIDMRSEPPVYHELNVMSETTILLKEANFFLHVELPYTFGGYRMAPDRPEKNDSNILELQTRRGTDYHIKVSRFLKPVDFLLALGFMRYPPHRSGVKLEIVAQRPRSP